MKQLVLLALVLATGCRGKNSGGPAVGSASEPKPPPAGESWSLAISGSSTLFDLASGPKGTFLVVSRVRGVAVIAAGKTVIEASTPEKYAAIQIDGPIAVGRPLPDEGVLDVGADALVGLESVGIATDGAVMAFDTGAKTPVLGNIAAIVRTSSALWLGGSNWNDEDSLSQGRCDRKQFVARQTRGQIEPVLCDGAWMSIELAAAGDDVIFCGSSILRDVEVGGTKLQAYSFLARIGADGNVRWVRAINELGHTSCEDVVVTSDGDVVAVGLAPANADFTEDAIAKGMKLEGTDDFGGGTRVGSKLWLARFAGDGKRRWVRAVGDVGLAPDASLAADRQGNVLLATAVSERLDLGHGPVGPADGNLVAAIDRDANVTGLAVVTGDAYSLRVAVDTRDGLVLAFQLKKSASFAGVTVMSSKASEYATGVIRVPLPLPAP